MSIQPIDLQNMYSQLSNVSKVVAGQQQAAQLNDSMQQQNQVQKNLENATKIQKANDKAKTQNTNEDGSNGGSGYYGQKKGNQNNRSDGNSIAPQNLNTAQSEYLGTIIDITR